LVLSVFRSKLIYFAVVDEVSSFSMAISISSPHSILKYTAFRKNVVTLQETATSMLKFIPSTARTILLLLCSAVSSVQCLTQIRSSISDSKPKALKAYLERKQFAA
jgi:hypothetical protein